MHLKNISLTKLAKRITSYKSNIGNKPNPNNLQRFNFIVYYHNKNLKYIKLSNQNIKCVLFNDEGCNQWKL